MDKFEQFEKIVEKKYSPKDKRRKPKMHVSGKSVFNLQRLMTRPFQTKKKK